LEEGEVGEDGATYRLEGDLHSGEVTRDNYDDSNPRKTVTNPESTEGQQAARKKRK